MAYASRTNIEDLWGSEFIADLIREDVDAEVAIARAVEQASGEIDTHLSARYATPIPGTAQALVMPCVNIAVYYLAIRHTSLTTTIEDRYKQAVELLKRIADGKAGLGADEPKVPTDDGLSSSGAAFYSGPRLFGRDRLP